MGPTQTWFPDSRWIHIPQCQEPGFYTKYNIPAASGYGARAAGMPGGCANHYCYNLTLVRIAFSVSNITITFLNTTGWQLYDYSGTSSVPVRRIQKIKSMLVHVSNSDLVFVKFTCH